MKIQTIDWFLYIVTFLLVIFGVVVTYGITYGGEATKNLTFYQIIFSFFGFLVLLILTFIDYRSLKAASYYLYGIIFFLLLILILVPATGLTLKGATRWINLGFFQFQPSEFFKLALIITVAKIVDEKEMNLKNFIILLLLILIPTVLVLKQPDFGTALVLLVTGFVIVFASGLDKRYQIILAIFAFLVILIFGLSYGKIKPFSYLLKDYQRKRVEIFLTPKKDPFGAGYNVSQSLIATGSGGLFGRGLGYGSQSQLNFIPSKQTDFIFAVSAEAFGFLGASILVFLFLILFLRILKIAYLAKDNFGTLLSYGILTLFILEVLVNIGMNIGIMPVTGIPLPFISYGGSSLLTSLAAVGICQSIMIRHKKITF